MAEVLNCEKRDFTGTLRNRRLRSSGKTPAVLYGRGDNVSLSILTKDVSAAIRRGNRIVELKGDLNENVMIKEVQWDAFGLDVLHIDLARIDSAGTVDITLKVELVGDAPGLKTGGMVKHLVHSVDVQCPSMSVPEKLELKINALELGGSLKASDIPLPDGAKLVSDADAIIAQCVDSSGEAEAETDADSDAPAEPEVIGRKSDDDEADE